MLIVKNWKKTDDRLQIKLVGLRYETGQYALKSFRSESKDINMYVASATDVDDIERMKIVLNEFVNYSR